MPGGVVTAARDGAEIALFLADAGGGVYTVRGHGTSWGSWSSVSDGGTVPGGVVNVVPVDDGFAVLVADRAGGVYMTTGRGAAWGPWATVAEGMSTPGGRIAATTWMQPWPPRQRRVLVLADPAGGSTPRVCHSDRTHDPRTADLHDRLALRGRHRVGPAGGPPHPPSTAVDDIQICQLMLTS